MLADEGPVYLWADSSPQVGSNWLLSMMFVIRPGFFFETARAARDLARLAARCDDPDTPLEDLTECARIRAEAGRVLALSMTVHSQVPMALGSGASGVEHILRCVIQKVFVEASSQSSCCEILNRLRGCCVDMGTEFQLTDAQLEVADLMPAWMKQAVEHEDGGVEPNLVEGMSDFLMPQSLSSAGELRAYLTMFKKTSTSS